MTKILIGNKEYSTEELAERLNKRYESQKEYHSKRNALSAKLFAFYRQYKGNCAELDAFLEE